MTAFTAFLITNINDYFNCYKVIELSQNVVVYKADN